MKLCISAISGLISYSKCLFKNDYLQLYFDGDPGLAIKHYGRENLKEDLNKKLNHRMGE